MKDAVARALARMRDADWFREQCARAPIVQQQVSEVVRRAGLRPTHFDEHDPSPGIAVAVGFEDVRHDELVIESSVTFHGYVLADVYAVTHHVRIANAAPAETRLDPFLDTELRDAPTKRAAHAESVITAAFRDLGWAELSREEEHEHAPTRPSDATVLGALETDPFGWLDGEPAEDRLAADLVPYRDLVARLYADPDTVIKGARSGAPWERPVEKLLLGYGRVQRLTPDNYPSVGWTIDFGDVTNGTFHARFLSDIYASKIAPVWFWTHRFIVDNVQPGALSETIEGWTVKQIGYTWPQQKALEGVRGLLSEQTMTELAPYFPMSRVAPSDDSNELHTLNEWLFRDPRGLADPAPRLEEEHPDRSVRVRRGGLRE